MPKKIWLLILSAIIGVILLPLGIDWLIIGNEFPSNISNSDWVGFFGGYIGSLVGAFVSLVGIIATIRFTREQLNASQLQYEEQKRMNYLPILDCEILGVKDGAETEALKMHVEYTLRGKAGLYPRTVNFRIYNIGIGAATELKYGMELNGVEQDGDFWIDHKRVIRSQESMEQEITIYTPYEKSFYPTLTLMYEDVLGNTYRKKVELGFEHNEDTGSFFLYMFKQDKGQMYHRPTKERRYFVVSELKSKEIDDVECHRSE